jgi:phosphoribosylaminoimidazole carboxylase (NCAIR synthetase)
LLAQLAQYGGGSRALLGEADLLLAEHPSLPAGLIGRAWCPTPLALADLRRRGVEPEPHPDQAVLRRVNHRFFAHELGGGLPEQSYIVRREQLRPQLAEPQRAWLLKRPLGFAGRGQLRIIGSLGEKQEAWIAASLKHDGLVVEPFVEPTLEVSLHGFVWISGRYELGRPCVQAVNERGVFKGVRLAGEGELLPSELDALHERASAVANELADARYFGPFGIDAYRYDAAGRTGFCALSEINARYTMGFATGFPRHPSSLSLTE